MSEQFANFVSIFQFWTFYHTVLRSPEKLLVATLVFLAMNSSENNFLYSARFWFFSWHFYRCLFWKKKMFAWDIDQTNLILKEKHKFAQKLTRQTIRFCFLFHISKKIKIYLSSGGFLEHFSETFWAFLEENL